MSNNPEKQQDWNPMERMCGIDRSSLAFWVNDRIEQYCIRNGLRWLDLAGILDDSQRRTSDRLGKCLATIVLESRRFDRVGWLHEWASSNPQSHVVAILSDWWQGSRRTMPLDKSIQGFYWYELPSLFRCLQPDHDLHVTNTGSMTVYGFSERRDLLDAWSNAFLNLGHAFVGLNSNKTLPVGAPHLIMYDSDGEASHESIDDRRILERIRVAYPSATKIAMMGYPRWSDACGLLEQGFDYVCGLPCRLEDLLCVASRFSSAALPLR